jgi:hypothetical protein
MAPLRSGLGLLSVLRRGLMGLRLLNILCGALVGLMGLGRLGSLR